MSFADNLLDGIDTSKPLCVAIGTPTAILPQFYSGELELPCGPGSFYTVGTEYEENPAGLSLARQVYEHLFGPTTLEFMRTIIRHHCYIGPKETTRFPEIGTEIGEEGPGWEHYCIIFDHGVPLGEDNLEAIQLSVDEQLKVTHRQSKDHREKINLTVQELPGMPEEYYGREALLSLKGGRLYPEFGLEEGQSKQID